MATTLAQLKATVSVEGADQAEKELDEFGKAVDKTADKSQAAAKKAMSHDEALRNVSQGAMVAGAGLLAGFGLAVGAAANFDKEMSGVGAVSNATAKEMDALREAALKAGADTAFSASEAAQAEAELVKAGVSTADVLGGALRGSLDLAAAGQINLAEAATIAAQAMNIFNLEGEDVSHVADVLAAGANKSAADVSQLGQALQQGGLLAKQTGLSLEDTVGTLAMFSDNALIGSDAGTSLKSMLQRLTPQSDEAADLMHQLGISAYDAAGQFVGLEGFAGNLRKSLKDLTPEARNSALGVIFGSDAVRAANILYEQGAKGVKKYTEAVNDQGAAGRMAGKQLDNLAGDLEQLKGSLETALIEGGSGSTSVLRGLTQGATDAVNAFGALPEPVSAVATGLVGIAGAGLLVTGGIGAMVPKIKEGIESLKVMRLRAQEMGPGMRSAAVGVTAFTAAVTAGFAAFSAGTKSAASGAAEADGILAGLDTTTFDGITDGMARVRAAMAETKRALAPSEGFGGGVAQLGQVLNPFVDNDIQEMVAEGERYKKLLQDLQSARTRFITKAGDVRTALAIELGKVSDFTPLITGAQLSDQAIARMADRLGVDLSAKGAEGKQALRQVIDSMLATTPAAYGSADAIGGIAAAAGDAEQELSDFKAMMDTVLGVQLSATEADIAFRESLDAVTQSVKDNGLTFDLNTAQGRANVSATIDASKAALAHAEIVGQQTQDVNAASMVMADHINQLAATQKALGLTDEATLIYLMDLYKIPPEARTDIKTTADLAALLVRGLKSDIDNLPAEKTVRVNVEQWIMTHNQSPRDGMPGRAPEPNTATGGYFPTGGLRMVGEQGRELVTLPAGSRVFSNSQTERMISGAGATSGGANVSVTFSPQITAYPGTNGVQIGRELAAYLEQYVNGGGGDLTRRLTGTRRG